MARDKEQMQDNLLRQFEKTAKRDNRTKAITFQEQVAEQEAFEKLPTSVKIQNLGNGEWQEEVYKTMNKMFHTGRYECERKMRIHFRKMDEFHTKGTSFAEVATWLEDQYLGY